ncbi:MAG TPA: wax ester/triacylglycerol synthase family O-acyltransferase [Candidatus Dormibacteraeota bacterium]|nr:wax ester/triacylglycerol synthase family O-acyltransferase [Candidatus Dormibacteraeota bacterium]
MAIATSESLSRADSAWLHAESPTNHFVVTSLGLLDSPLDLRRFKSMLARRISQHPRLTQVVSESSVPGVPPRWEAARDFDLDAHVHSVGLPGAAGMDELAAFIGDLVGQPLDIGRPLWQVYAVEGPEERGALVSRFHHSLGDGQAMVRMLLSLTDETAEGWKRRARPGRPGGSAHDGRSAFTRVLDSLPPPATLTREALGTAETLARLTLLDPDRPTPLRGELGLLKAVAWTPPIPLRQIKRVASASATTVNDVVVSAIAGGLGDYLRSAHVDTRGLRIRAMVPVNLRPPEDTTMTGNRFSLVYLELPVGVTGARERLMRVKTEMDRIKASREPAVGWLLVQGLGVLPAGVERLVSGFYAAKASLVLTNVVGPKERVYVAGVPLRQMTFWEPESGGLGLGVSIYSYAGDVTVGVVADLHLVAQPRQITQAVSRAFAALAAEF